MRRWMRDAELWSGSGSARARSRPPRRAVVGELCQWDSSVHPWLEERGADDLVLIAIHDDATSGLQTARFVERDNGAERFTVARGDPCDAHRPLPADMNLDALFAETDTRGGGQRLHGPVLEPILAVAGAGGGRSGSGNEARGRTAPRRQCLLPGRGAVLGGGAVGPRATSCPRRRGARCDSPGETAASFATLSGRMARVPGFAVPGRPKGRP